jgi:hypothetical protein
MFALACVHPVAVLLSTLQLSRCQRKQVSLASLSPFEDRHRTPGTELHCKEQIVLGSLSKEKSFRRFDLRSCLPVVIGDIAIMPQYLSLVKSFLARFL